MIISRFFPLRLCAAAWLALALTLCTPARADTIAVKQAFLQADSNGWSLDASFEFELNSILQDAVNKGVSLYFTTHFELIQPRWYWFDETPVKVSRDIRLLYQPLTREYRISSGGLTLRFGSLAEALAFIKHVTSWHVIDRNQIEPGETYIASVSMHLDTALMPKPFQADAVNNRDWNLSSDRKLFSFTATEHEK